MTVALLLSLIASRWPATTLETFSFFSCAMSTVFDLASTLTFLFFGAVPPSSLLR